MKFKNLLMIKAIVCLFFGVLLLAVPDKLISLFGASLSDGGIFTAREYASSLLGNMMLCWFARNADESEARKAIIIALFAYDLIAFIMTVFTVIAGVLNALGWLIALVYLFFTIGFGYFVIKPNAIETT